MIKRIMILALMVGAWMLSAAQTSHECPSCAGKGHRVIQCHSCHNGAVLCVTCHGAGTVKLKCQGCNGGYVSREVKDPCPTCNGKGYERVNQPKKCTHCRNGVVPQAQNGRQRANPRSATCQHCRGTGTVDNWVNVRCSQCNNRKYVGSHTERTVHEACGGTGYTQSQCRRCQGRGGTVCTRCDGYGNICQECQHCHGTGRVYTSH